MVKKMMLLVMVAVLAVVLGGCAAGRPFSRALEKAKVEAEIDRLRAENKKLEKRLSEGIKITVPGVEAELSAYGHDNLLEEVIPEMIGEEAAKAELYRMKVAAVKRAAFSEGGVSRNSTKVHFWFDEAGQEWVRGYIKNMTPDQRIVDLRIAGSDVVLSNVTLEPGEGVENIWAKAGMRVHVTGRAIDVFSGKFIGNVYYDMLLRFSGANPVAKIGAVYYQWRIIFEGG